ncbi:MAG: 5-(carboxyamino)imidazole ribonucleotide synthase [Pseudomonadota bacterium]
MAEIVVPGGTVGILGGGQLGRMLAIAAARMGLRTHIYAPDEDPPAGHVAAAVTTAGWDDAAALARFAEAVDVVTYEFENVPLATAEIVAAHAPLHPGRQALAVSQDRWAEKSFLQGEGLATAPFAQVDDIADLERAIAEIGTPAILKTRRLGYDGKGQARIADPSGAEAAMAAIGRAPAILEGFVDFRAELSVIGARGLDGRVACFDPAENVHVDGMLQSSTVPATLPKALQQEAVLATGRLLNALDYVGVIGVEFFAGDQGLLVNEFAPRVHNSGHWTIEACPVDQFAQHIRAICGWPLGDGARLLDAVMENVVGHDAAGWAEMAERPDTGLHLYGKAEARAGRKMGHATRTAPRRG